METEHSSMQHQYCGMACIDTFMTLSIPQYSMACRCILSAWLFTGRTFSAYFIDIIFFFMSFYCLNRVLIYSNGFIDMNSLNCTAYLIIMKLALYKLYCIVLYCTVLYCYCIVIVLYWEIPFLFACLFCIWKTHFYSVSKHVRIDWLIDW